MQARQESISTTVMPQTAASAPAPEAIPRPNEYDYATRWFENVKFISGPEQAAIKYTLFQHENTAAESNDVSCELQIGTFAGIGGGLIMGYLLHRIVKHRYIKKSPFNPLYRVFKTLACLGAVTGMVVAKSLPLQGSAQTIVAAILSDIISFGLGLFALPYWLIRHYLLKKSDAEESRNDLIGKESWSKYAKTFLVFGTCLGQALGALYSHFMNSDFLTTCALMGGITGISFFILGVTLVPLINRLFGRILVSDSKDEFRNNYVRSGITLGLCLGSVLGFVGSLFIPGIGGAVGMAIGAAVGSVFCGSMLGLYGNRITQCLRKIWNVSEDTDNSWDYATRNSSFLFAFLGTAIGLFIPGGAIIGGAIGGLFGWLAGLGIIRLARHFYPEEQKSKTLPWTQRVACGANMGSMIGGAIGFILCLVLGGPAGAIAGAAMCAAIGGFLGGLIGALYERPKESANPKLTRERCDAEPVAKLSDRYRTHSQNPYSLFSQKHPATTQRTNDTFIQDTPRPVMLGA